jgi:hypothetical protein
VCPTLLWRSSKVKLVLFLLWFILVLISTEVVLSVYDNRDRIYAEGDPLPYEKKSREENSDFKA